MEAQISTIGAHVEAIELEVHHCSVAIARHHQLQVADGSSLHQQLTVALIPLAALSNILGPPSEPARPSFDTSVLSSGSPAAGVGSGTNQRTMNFIQHTEPITMVTTKNLGNMLQQMHESRTPAIYEFQGLEMRYTDIGDPTIRLNRVTLRNGRITLSNKQTLVVEGKGVVLENFDVIGGKVGVLVEQFKSITLVDCLLRDNGTGLALCANATASVIDSDFIGQRMWCISALAGSSLEGTRLQITGGRGAALLALDKAAVTLTDCALPENPGSLGKLQGGASLVMTRCAVNGEFERDDTSTLEVLP